MRDRAFLRRLRRVMDGRDLLMECGAKVPPEDLAALDLGGLVTVRRAYLFGRPAALEEWARLEAAQRALGRNLTPANMLLLRTQRARRVITWLPIGLLAMAILGIVAASFEQMVIGVANVGGLSVLTPYAAKLTGYLLWTLSLGGLGAAASLGVNALDIRNDATFDVNDGALVALRLVVGAVFAFVISLVFTWDSFGHFLGMLTGEQAGAKPVDQLDLAWRLLLPFLLGFSTPLALTVLERFIVAIETFFGARASLTPKQMAAAVAAGTAAGIQEQQHQQDAQGQQPAPGRQGQQPARIAQGGQGQQTGQGPRSPGMPGRQGALGVTGGQGPQPSPGGRALGEEPAVKEEDTRA